MGNGSVVYLNTFQKGNHSWEDLLEEFLSFKGAEGKSERTLLDYRKIVSLYFKRHPKALENPSNSRRAVLSFLKETRTPTTYNQRLQNLRIFYSWLVEEEVVDQNPLLQFKKQRNPGRFIPVEAEVLKRLLDLPDRRTFSGLRDHALVLFTLDTATRPGEALQLIPSDFNLRSLEVKIPAQVSKTRIARTLYISSGSAKVLKKLMRVRHPEWKGDVPLFCSRDGQRMKETSWGQQMRRYSERLGVKITPYMLRHSSATLFLRNGGNAMALQRMMGHTSMEMTERYVHLVEGDIKAQHAQFSPLKGIVSDNKRIQTIISNTDARLTPT